MSERFGKGLRGATAATMDDLPDIASYGEECRDWSEKERWVETNRGGVE